MWDFHDLVERKPLGNPKLMAATPTDLGQLHQLLGGRHHALRLHLVHEAVGDVGVSVIEELADDEPVQVLPVLQSWFGSIHDASG